MLDVSYYGRWTVGRIDVVLLYTRVAANGEESGSGSVVTNGGNTINCWYSFIRYSFGANVPGAGLPAVIVVSPGAVKRSVRYIPFSVLHNAAVL
jgi:hypothetical protein